MASLVMLVYTILDDVACLPKNECKVGIGYCTELRVRRDLPLSLHLREPGSIKYCCPFFFMLSLNLSVSLLKATFCHAFLHDLLQRLTAVDDVMERSLPFTLTRIYPSWYFRLYQIMKLYNLL